MTYRITTSDGFQQRVPTLEMAAAELSRLLERAAMRQQSLTWTITGARGDEINGTYNPHTSPVTAAIEHTYAVLIRHHLDTT